MNIVVTCTGCPAPSAELYRSQDFKNAHHRFNAYRKAHDIARAHAEAANHRVDVNDGATLRWFECKCGICDKPLPGNASGACGPCAMAEVTRRVDALLKENA